MELNPITEMKLEHISEYCDNLITDSSGVGTSIVLETPYLMACVLDIFDDRTGFTFHVMNGAWDGSYDITTSIMTVHTPWGHEHYENIGPFKVILSDNN